MTIPPGLIAWLYQMRWDIEPERSGDSWPSSPETCQQKSYDEVKNKFHEQKAWASSPTAKEEEGCQRGAGRPAGSVHHGGNSGKPALEPG